MNFSKKNHEHHELNKIFVSKKMNLTTKMFMVLAVFALTFFGCSNNEAIEIEEQELQQDYSEVVLSSEIDEASEAMDDIALDVFETQQESETSRTQANFSVPDCVTITVVIEQGFREITIDFGTEGCLIRGNELKGKIILSYDANPEAQEILITKTLEDFYFNNKNIIGGKTILRERSNENGNPQFTKTVDLTVIWPNGAEASRAGTKVREWIEGHGSGVWSDNVFEITGNWTSTFRNGNSHSYEVIIPLRREVICYYFVSGSVDIERTNFSGVLDYGEGDCDNLATFTNENGNVREIILN
ncbi:MAG: hypothetical protein KAJ28_06800 [Flavobacteriaceae bacterium]|nr:hypothetical protein [Flavobacteriaceae bacterium]